MILITGGAGYIGSHTAVKFLNAGYDLVIFDNLETGHIETIEELKKIGNVEFVKGDLKNIGDIEKVFESYKIDAVVHFAAYSLVGESVKNPAKYYRNNVFGTLNLLDTMLKHKVSYIVFSSTCAIYGEPEYVPLDEKHPKNPINSYGQSKLMVENIMQDYDKAYGLKSVKLRYFNVVGADEKERIGEWHDPESHLVPNILKSVFNKGETFKIFGEDYPTPDGTCIRDYVNINDLADAHLLAYEFLQYNDKSEVFNLGTENGNSVREVFSICEKVLDLKIDVDVVERREGDPATLFADSRKAKNTLRWNPKNSLETSVKTAYAWEEKLQKILNKK